MVLIPQTDSLVLEPPLVLKRWIVSGVCIFAVAVALCLIFPHEAASAYRVWLTSTAYNHCFLILPVALFLAWQRRYVLQQLAPQPDLRFLALLLPASVAWLVTALVSVTELQQLIVLSMFQIIAVGVLGWRAYRALLLPFLYLYFLVPSGYFLVPWLQNATAWMAVEGLKLFGIPVFSDGTVIEVPAGSFVVAEACAGLRFLIASVAFGVFFAAVTYRSRVRAVVFIGLSVIVPIIANGMRAFGIIALAELLDSAKAAEADHIIYGWVFFSLVTLALIVIGMRFADDWPKLGALPAPAPNALITTTRMSGMALAAIIGLAVAATGPAYAEYRDWRGAAVNLTNAPAPPVGSPWVPVEHRLLDWQPLIHDPDRVFLRTFDDGGQIVAQYVALYQAKGFHNDLVRGLNEVADPKRWQLNGTGKARVRIDGRDASIATTEVSSGGHKLMVWHFYVVNGAIAASPMQAKLAQIRGLIGSNDDVAAFVALATEVNGTGRSSQELQRFLAAMGSLPRYLQGITAR